jgi:HSP20 family protein
MRYTLGNPIHLHHAPPTLAPPLSLRQIMDHLVESAFAAGPVPAGNAGGVSSPALNAYDAGDFLVVETQVPGMKPEDIDVSIEQGMLTIQGKTQAEQAHEERNYLSHEYQLGNFSRSVRLPESIDSDGVKATYEHGVLRLTLPKAVHSKTHRIRVEDGNPKSVNGVQGAEQEPERFGESVTSGRPS